jgi:inorganic pyrophosphatase
MAVQNYKVLEGKEVDVGNFSDPQEAKDAIRHAIRLYDEHFAQAGHAAGTKAE